MHKNIKFFGIIIFFNDLRTKEPPQIFLGADYFCSEKMWTFGFFSIIFVVFHISLGMVVFL